VCLQAKSPHFWKVNDMKILNKAVSYFKDQRGVGVTEILIAGTVAILLISLWQFGAAHKGQTYEERKKTGKDITDIFEDPNVDLNKTYDEWKEKLRERLYGSGKTAIGIYDDYGIHTFLNETTDLYKVKTDDKPKDKPSINDDIKQTIKDRVEDLSNPDAKEADIKEVSESIIDKFYTGAKQKIGSASGIIKAAIDELAKRKIAADKKQIELRGQQRRLSMEIKSLQEQMEFMEEQSGGYIDEYEYDYDIYSELKSRLDKVNGMLSDVESELKNLGEVLTGEITQIEAASTTLSEDIDEELQEAYLVNIEDVIGSYSTEFIWMWTEELDSANGTISFTVDSDGDVSGQFSFKWTMPGGSGDNTWIYTSKSNGPISGSYDALTNKLKIDGILTAHGVEVGKDYIKEADWNEYIIIEAKWVDNKFAGTITSWPVGYSDQVQSKNIEIPKN